MGSSSFMGAGVTEEDGPGAFDFENPSLGYILEDYLKGLLGGPLLYSPFLRQRGGLEGRERVLDFGCGGGTGTRSIAKRLRDGGSVVGIDVSSSMLRRARRRLRRFRNVELVHGDVRQLPPPRERFDIVFIFHVLHDISRSERGDIVRALAGMLRPGGSIWISEPTKEGHGMPAGEVRSLMRQAGLYERAPRTDGARYSATFTLLQAGPRGPGA